MQSFGYLAVSFAFVSQQQNPSTIEFASGVLTAFKKQRLAAYPSPRR
jgi:hypothetical protein